MIATLYYLAIDHCFLLSRLVHWIFNTHAQVINRVLQLVVQKCSQNFIVHESPVPHHVLVHKCLI